MLTDEKCSIQSKAILPTKPIMPITWTNENVSRLFLVTLAVHHIHMDYKQIAQAFGGDATPRAIEEKMKKLRKEARGITDDTTDSIPITRRGRGAGRGGFKAVACTPGKRRGRKPKHLKELELQQAREALEEQGRAKIEDDEELRQSCLPEMPHYGDLMANHLLKKGQMDKVKMEEQDYQDEKVFHQTYQQIADGGNSIDPVLEQIHFHNAERFVQDDLQNVDVPQTYDDEYDFEDKVDPLLRYQTLQDADLSNCQAHIYDAYPNSLMTLNDVTTVQTEPLHSTPHFQSYEYPAAYVPHKEPSVDQRYDTDDGYLYEEEKLCQVQDETSAGADDPAIRDSFYHTSSNFADFEVDRFGGSF